MESGKQATSEICSEEIDQTDEIMEETSTKQRSYKCTFCKRGFTNAQALGGHMNIHRKDRAKDKHVSNSNKSNEACMPSRSKYHPVLETQRNYNMYFQPNPRPLHAFHESDHHGAKLVESISMKDELFAANLNLKIGASPADGIKEMKREIEKEDGVDLELRLGHNP